MAAAHGQWAGMAASRPWPTPTSPPPSQAELMSGLIEYCIELGLPREPLAPPETKVSPSAAPGPPPPSASQRHKLRRQSSVVCSRIQHLATIDYVDDGEWGGPRWGRRAKRGPSQAPPHPAGLGRRKRAGGSHSPGAPDSLDCPGRAQPGLPFTASLRGLSSPPSPSTPRLLPENLLDFPSCRAPVSFPLSRFCPKFWPCETLDLRPAPSALGPRLLVATSAG